MADNPAFMPVTEAISQHQQNMLYYDENALQEERLSSIQERDETKERYESLKEEESEETGGSTYEQAYAEVNEKS